MLAIQLYPFASMLEVALFHTLKIEWRRILEKGRRESRIKGSIPKNQFPGLLALLQRQLKSGNLRIFPFDREMVMKRLPHVNKDIEGGTGSTVNEVFNEAIAGLIIKYCGQDGKTKRTRAKKITPGKAITR